MKLELINRISKAIYSGNDKEAALVIRDMDDTELEELREHLRIQTALVRKVLKYREMFSE